MINQVVWYLKFLYQSTNQYGVHSPFVYQFLIKGLYKSADASALKHWKNFRSQLLNTHQTIDVKDFGAGSSIFKDSERMVSQMAKNAGLSITKAKIFNQILHYFQPKNMLELGTHLGLSAKMTLETLPKIQLTTVEGCPQTFAFVNNLNVLKKTKFINQTFETFFEENTNSFDAIFLDGNHQKQATIDYVEHALKILNNNGFIILDDIYWSQGMKEAWNDICALPTVDVSIDLFYFGLIFKRPQQVKQHFVIRTKPYFLI